MYIVHLYLFSWSTREEDLNFNMCDTNFIRFILLVKLFILLFHNYRALCMFYKLQYFQRLVLLLLTRDGI